MTEREYQSEIQGLLGHIYDEVEIQWHPFRGEGRAIYSPAIDIAVGPFAINERLEEEYTRLLHGSRMFVDRLIDAHNGNVRDHDGQVVFDELLHFNENARCLIAIEIEKSGSKKHCIGDLVNASALGRIGLLIAWSQDMLRTFLRQRVYLAYLAGVGKNTFKTTNALVLTKEQLYDCIGVMIHHS